MASLSSGEYYTEAQVNDMTGQEKNDKQIVGLSLEDQAEMSGMNRAERRRWMKDHKKFKKHG